MPPMTTSSGMPTGAVYGFIRMMMKAIDLYQPDGLVIAADAPGPNFRHQKYPEYKANRPAMPEDLRSQVELLRRAADVLQVPWLECRGYEADDIIATLARLVRRDGKEMIIISGDKDLAQLVGEGISLASPAHEDQPMDPAAVKEKYGVEPVLLGDLLALAGDTSDNIPGVPGVGLKTAARLLGDYGNLDGVFSHLDEIKGSRVRENLRANVEQARLSRELVALNDVVPLEMSPDDLEMKEPDPDRRRAFYRELEFRSLLRETLSPRQNEDKWIPVSTPEEFHYLQEEMFRNENVTILALAEGEDDLSLPPCGLAVEAGEKIHLVDLREAALRRTLQEFLAPVMADPAVSKTTHDYKRAVHLFRALGLGLSGVRFDTLLAAYLLNPSKGDYSLDTLALEELGWKLRDKGMPIGREDLPLRLRAVSRLRGILTKRLRQQEQEELLLEMEIPVSLVLAGMEERGIGLDVALLTKMSEELESRLEELAKKMYELAGEKFNLNSPAQLRTILFERLLLKPGKKTKTGYSTDVGVLRKLAAEHPLPGLLLEYRAYFKLRSTYVDALPDLVAADGKLHTTFHQAVTATGRLSSSRPNLQNIPVRTELGKKIREAFVPSRPDWEFLSADYSQIELRLLAHLSGDEKMISAFREDRDIHAFTASLIFSTPLDKVTPEMRRRAKTINFGLIYGMGQNRLSRELEISRKEAADFIEAYFSRYPQVKEYYDRVIDQARDEGYVSTIFHRRRYLPELNSRRPQERAFGERAAMNTPIQGSAADIIKKAMVAFFRRLPASDLQGRLLLQIHDELLLETPPDETLRLVKTVRGCMENVVKLSVPVVVDFKRGKNWGSLEKFFPEGK